MLTLPMIGILAAFWTAGDGVWAPLHIDERKVREAVKERRSGSISTTPAPNMPANLGSAVCGRVGLGQRGMPERFIYVQYVDKRLGARLFFERGPEPSERHQFHETWRQLNCLGL